MLPIFQYKSKLIQLLPEIIVVEHNSFNLHISRIINIKAIQVECIHYGIVKQVKCKDRWQLPQQEQPTLTIPVTETPGCRRLGSVVVRMIS